jgi:hypothetical protein
MLNLDTLPLASKVELLQKLLIPLDAVNAESDTVIRLASTVLFNLEIEHVCYVGRLHASDGEEPFHCWIKVQELYIDFRAKAHFGDLTPHGVFIDPVGMKYVGAPMRLSPLTASLFKLLSGLNLYSFKLGSF